MPLGTYCLIMDGGPTHRTPSGYLAWLATEHLGLLVSAMLVAVTLLHVLVVAGWDLPTALAVLDVADRTQVLLASAASVAVAIGATAVLQFRRVWPTYRRFIDGSTAQQGVATIGFILGLSAIPAIPVGAGLLIVLIYAFGQMAVRRASRRGGVSEDGRVLVSRERWSLVTLFAWIATGWILIVILTQPWVPFEEVSLRDDTSVTGYVIGQDGAMTLVLDDRQAKWIKTDDVDARRICGRDQSWWQYSLSDIGLDYKPCD